MKKLRQSLGFKISVAALAMCLLLCAAALISVFVLQTRQQNAVLDQIAGQLCEALKTSVSAQMLEDCANGASVPEGAELAIQNAQRIFSADRVTVACGDSIVLDTAPGSGKKLSQQALFASCLPTEQQREPRSVTVRQPDGSRYRVHAAPVAYADGTVVGYILTALAVPANEVLGFVAWIGLVLAAVLIVVLTVYLVYARKIVITPIRQLTDAVQAYEGGENKASLRRLELKGNDELRSLADAFRMMLVEIDLRGFEERELAVREERVEAELKLTTAVNAAMEPKALPGSSARAVFDVRGLTDQSGEMIRDFYDYFLLEDGKLGVVLGEVPGEGVSAALFMVVAKTVIKSQLRVGMPLLESAAEANRQLYEVGQGMVVNAIIGVLDENGLFTYINAGQQHPILMRSQDRYEWYAKPVYAPLGQNENVTYQVQELELRQGDRLFFHTAGLARLTNREGESFTAHGLQASLNASRSKQPDLNGLLQLVRDDGKVFAERSHGGGFAMLVLDYLRARKDLAHCVVTRDRSGAMSLASFLKRQLRENGFDPREVAQVAVLADEIFAQCCRQRADSLITVECQVEQQRRLVTLRWKSVFGSDPLLGREGGDTDLSVRFIRGACKSILFRQGELQDELTVVKQL